MIRFESEPLGNPAESRETILKPELSIIVSALNEEQRVGEVLRRIVAVLAENHINGEVIFLDNHSTDRTGAIADSIAENFPNIRIIHRSNRPNKDLGSSLMEGIENVRGDFFLIMDCDLSHNPNDIPRLFAKRGQADIIIGSRFTTGGSAQLHWKRKLLSKIYNTFARLVTGVPAYDITTGFKLYRKKAVDNISVRNNGFGLHVELPITAYLAGATVLEVPIHYANSPKFSTLRYRKQFVSYMNPVIRGGWCRIKKFF